MFQKMADYTELIYQDIDASLTQLLTFNTFSIEFYVYENNPKALNPLIKKLKTFYKGNPNVDPYKMVDALTDCFLS